MIQPPPVYIPDLASESLAEQVILAEGPAAGLVEGQRVQGLVAGWGGAQ